LLSSETRYTAANAPELSKRKQPCAKISLITAQAQSDRYLTGGEAPGACGCNILQIDIPSLISEIGDI
jgi:hypothetical protein